MDQRQTSADHRADPTAASRMSLTVYLDEGYGGGDIAFVTGVGFDGSFAASHFSHHPSAGDAVLFYQAVQEFAHVAYAPREGCKTIMRSDVMYRFSSEEQADVGGLRVEGGAP